MKKGLPIFFAAALLTGFVSCGPSAEDRRADSLKQDSVETETADATQRMIDSIEAANKAYDDSVAQADSIKKADSAAKAGQ